MVNAQDIIQYDRTDWELEELVLFLVAVAGHNAETTSKALRNFFYTDKVSPFQQVKEMDTVTGMLLERLKQARMGCYTKLEKSYRQLANSNIDLRTCTLEDLMKFHGVGRKSASCFIGWTRRGQKMAMLDTHLLKFLRSQQTYFLSSVCPRTPLSLSIAEQFKDLKIPRTTPSSKKLYDKLENIYLDICKFYKKDPIEFDLELWKLYSAGYAL